MEGGEGARGDHSDDIDLDRGGRVRFCLPYHVVLQAEHDEL